MIILFFKIATAMPNFSAVTHILAEFYAWLLKVAQK